MTANLTAKVFRKVYFKCYQQLAKCSTVSSETKSTDILSNKKNLPLTPTWLKNFPMSDFSNKLVTIAFVLADNLNLPPAQVLHFMKKHRFYHDLTLADVEETYDYLIDLGFGNKVIADTPSICFYPRESVEEGFKEIIRNSENLKKYGLYDGIVEEKYLKPEMRFENGTKYLDKRLQLCVYYMEKYYQGNGDYFKYVCQPTDKDFV